MDTQPPLLTLPTEVRLQIYNIIFVNFAFSVADDSNAPSASIPDPTRPPSSLGPSLPDANDTNDTPKLRYISPLNDHTIGALSLLQTSNQIRSEAMSILKQRLASHPLVLYYKHGPFTTPSSFESRNQHLPLTPPLSTSIRLFILPYGRAGGWSIVNTLTSLRTIGSCVTISEQVCQNLANDDLATFRQAIMSFLTLPRFRRRRWQIFSYLMSASRAAKRYIAIWFQLRFVTQLKIAHQKGSDSNAPMHRIRQAVWINMKASSEIPGGAPRLVWCRPTRWVESDSGDGGHHATETPSNGAGDVKGNSDPFYNPPLEEPGLHPELDQIVAAWPESGNRNDGVNEVSEWCISAP
jgi:hypothetical protein